MSSKPDQKTAIDPKKPDRKAGWKSRGGGRNQRAAKKMELRMAQTSKPLLDRIAEDRRPKTVMSTEEQMLFRRRQVKIAYKMLGFEKNSLREKVALLVFEAFVELQLANDTFELRFTAAETKMQLQLSQDELRMKNDIVVGVRASEVMLKRAYRALKSSTSSKTKELVAA